MKKLAVSDFGAFFQEVNDHPPFPWQTRLAERVASAGWPNLLDLPTGAGKTTAIEVAIFHLALEASLTTSRRVAPVRLALVVDRRVVVDQAYEHALRLAKALETAKPGTVASRVAERLSSLSNGGPPLAATVLRGGMVRDESWARTPDQPLVIVSTVDQVGSRLLFRGYGLSASMRPVHAGLLGNDTLLLLDEVHLSTPFRDTLRALARYRTKPGDVLPNRFRFVEMSATPSAETPSGFSLNSDDLADAVLAKRLNASKRARLELIKVPTHEPEPVKLQAFAAGCAEEAWRHRERTGARVLGVVVNRVASARHVAAALRKRAGAGVDVVLVTGRMRPLDRQDIWEGEGGRPGLRERISAGRKRRTGDRLLFLVATQTVEAGADLDLDAIVTECASIDALRQRFGRVDRRGELGESESLILTRSDLVKNDDPVYGPALSATWKWLEGVSERRVIEMGVIAFGEKHGAPPADCISPSLPGPPVLPAHLDAWAQTRPGPSADPQPSFWLHGADREIPEVQVVWRADLSDELLKLQSAAEDQGKMPGPALERLQICPPSSLEAVSVPLWSVRSWLRGQASDLAEQEAHLADVEGSAAPEEPWRARRTGRQAVRWSGDQSRVVNASSITAGDTLVVPSSYGGLADGVWSPDSVAPVLDLGDRVQWEARRKPTFRLDPSTQALGWAHVWQPPALPGREPEDCEADRDAIATWLDTISADPTAPHWARKAAEALIRRTTDGSLRWRLSVDILAIGHSRMAVAARRRAFVDEDGTGTTDTATDEDTSSFTGVDVPLDAHCQGVGELARAFGERIGLPLEMVGDLALAGLLHDVGKADRRFQQMLRGGDAVAVALAEEPIAKSSAGAGDNRGREEARRKAGWPRGLRHEILSAVLAQCSTKARERAHDWDLVLHLVASHHGWCRPLPAPELDPSPVELRSVVLEEEIVASTNCGLTRIDGGILDRFWRLSSRYGWHGLAWLEAILRLADHRCSQQEEQA